MNRFPDKSRNLLAADYLENGFDMLEFNLNSEGYSNNEISDYMREKRVRIPLMHSQDLWKLTPEKTEI